MKTIHQRLFLYSSLAAVLVLAGWQWGVRPLLDRQEELAWELATSEKLLAQMYTLEKTFAIETQHSQGVMNKLGKQRNFNLFAYLESMASKDGIRDKIDAMSPKSQTVNDAVREEQVEMRLRGVYLDHLVPYLYHIETAPQMIRIVKFRLKSNDRKPLDVDMVLATYVVNS